MKSRSRPATVCVCVPSGPNSLKTGPPSTDEIDLPFAGFVSVTVKLRSTCKRSRTSLPASSKYSQTVNTPSECEVIGKPQTPSVRVVSTSVWVTTLGGAAAAAGARAAARSTVAARSRTGTLLSVAVSVI